MQDNPSQESFASIAINDSDARARIRALEQVRDVHLLGEIAQQSIGSNIRIRALEKLPKEGFEGIRLKIALRDRDPRVALKALEPLSDPTDLFRIEHEAPHSTIRASAAVKLNDIEVLRQIAVNSTDDEVCLTSVINLDLVSLARIAVEIKIDKVRRVAVSRVTDQSVLAQIAQSDSSEEIRYEAVHRLTDPKFLAQLARNCPFSDVRRIAVAKIPDPTLLAELFHDERDNNVRVSAIENMTCRKTLKTISAGGFDPELTSAASARIFKLFSKPCSLCRGTGFGFYGGMLTGGRRWSHPCKACTGKGRILDEKW